MTKWLTWGWHVVHETTTCHFLHNLLVVGLLKLRDLLLLTSLSIVYLGFFYVVHFAWLISLLCMLFVTCDLFLCVVCWLFHVGHLYLCRAWDLYLCIVHYMLCARPMSLHCILFVVLGTCFLVLFALSCTLINMFVNPLILWKQGKTMLLISF
jgi:hypothetical protein